MAEPNTKASLKIPEAPPVLSEIAQCGDDINKVGEVISQDEALAQEVLNIINAPYFQLVRKIQSVGEAGRMLGLTRLYNLTTGRLLKDTVFAAGRRGMDELWQSSLKVAVISILISKQKDLGSVDEVYTTALFHNAGMALMVSGIKGYWNFIKKSYLNENSNISQDEESALGLSHAGLGSRLANTWGLSAPIAQAIALHHSPEDINTKLNKKSDSGDILITLKLAERIARLPSYITRTPDDHEWNKIEESCLDYLKFTDGMFKRFEHNIKVTLSEMKY